MRPSATPRAPCRRIPSRACRTAALRAGRPSGIPATSDSACTGSSRTRSIRFGRYCVSHSSSAALTGSFIAMMSPSSRPFSSVTERPSSGTAATTGEVSPASSVGFGRRRRWFRLRTPGRQRCRCSGAAGGRTRRRNAAARSRTSRCSCVAAARRSSSAAVTSACAWSVLACAREREAVLVARRILIEPRVQRVDAGIVDLRRRPRAPFCGGVAAQRGERNEKRMTAIR